MEETCRAFVLDLPGFGASVLGDLSGDVDDAATLVHRVLHTNGQTDPLIVVGHAYGGLVALNFAARFPGHVSRLVLVSTAGFDRNPAATLERRDAVQSNGWDAAAADGWLRAGLVEDLAEAHLEAMREQAAEVNADLIAACLGSSARRVLLEDATDVNLPLLLVRGSDDPFVTDDDLQILAARMPGAEVFTLAGVGHWPSLEAPDELRAELVRFFKV